MEGEQNLNSLVETHRQELFSELIDEIEDDNITDIEWDGYNLWITDLSKGSYMSCRKLSPQYVENLSIRLANVMKVSFNRYCPVLEANTQQLRISIWHESRCGNKSMAIRKIPEKLRFNHESLVESGYISEPILNLIENCVRAHCSVVIGGQPHAGKTELLKYLSTFIPDDEKVGVYEDNQEIHYRKINPGKKCIEFFVDDKFTYSQVIKAGLRHNIDWVLLSESRGPEVLALVNSLSTGAYCMTTIHVDDVAGIPERMYNMLGEQSVSDRLVNSIYQYIDVGILVECDKYEKRKVTQVGFFSHADKDNFSTVIYDNCCLMDKDIPIHIKEKMLKYGIDNEYGRGN